MSLLPAVFMSLLVDAWRDLRRAPRFSLAVIVTLGAALGANTALFSAANAVLVRRLAVRQPGQLVILSQVNERGQVRAMPLGALAEFATDQQAFEAVCGHSGGPLLTVERDNTLSPAATELVTGEYYDTLGVAPFLGRLIAPSDVANPNAPAAVAVVGHRFWRQRLNASPAAVGSTIRVEGYPVTVIGVTPPGFDGLNADIASDVTIPAALLDRILGLPPDPNRPVRVNSIVARMRPGWTMEAATAHVRSLHPAVQRAALSPSASPAERAEAAALRPVLEPLERGVSALRTRYSTPLVFLVGLTLSLLLLACLNLGGFFLGRVAAEERDLAVRHALGASLTRLAMGLLLRSVLMAALAWLVALPFVWWTLAALRRAFSTGLLPVTTSLTPDPTGLAASLGVAVVAGILVGSVPRQRRGPRSPRRRASALRDERQQRDTAVPRSVTVPWPALTVAQGFSPARRATAA